MSDEEREDTLLAEAADSDTLTGDEAQTDDGAVETPSLIFGKYKSMEEAEKALKGLEQKFHATAAENATLREKAEMKQVLDKITELSESKSKGADESIEAYNRAVAEIAEDFRENPEEGVKKLTQLNNAWLSDMENKLSQATEAKYSELAKRFEEIQERIGDMNPDYIEHKAMVDQLVADGMPKAKAIEWAKKLDKGSSRVLPTSMNGTVKRGGEKKDVYLTKEDRARMKIQDGLTDEQLDAIEEEYQMRRANGGRMI